MVQSVSRSRFPGPTGLPGSTGRFDPESANEQEAGRGHRRTGAVDVYRRRGRLPAGDQHPCRNRRRHARREGARPGTRPRARGGARRARAREGPVRPAVAGPRQERAAARHARPRRVRAPGAGDNRPRHVARVRIQPRPAVRRDRPGRPPRRDMRRPVLGPSQRPRRQAPVEPRLLPAGAGPRRGRPPPRRADLPAAPAHPARPRRRPHPPADRADSSPRLSSEIAPSFTSPARHQSTAHIVPNDTSNDFTVEFTAIALTPSYHACLRACHPRHSGISSPPNPGHRHKIATMGVGCSSMSGNGKGLDSDAIVIDPALPGAARYALQLASFGRGPAALGSRYGPHRGGNVSARDVYRAIEAYTAAGRFARLIPFQQDAPAAPPPPRPPRVMSDAAKSVRNSILLTLVFVGGTLLAVSVGSVVTAVVLLVLMAASAIVGIRALFDAFATSWTNVVTDPEQLVRRTTPTAGTCAMPRPTTTAVTSCRGQTWTRTPGKSGAGRSPPRTRSARPKW